MQDTTTFRPTFEYPIGTGSDPLEHQTDCSYSETWYRWCAVPPPIGLRVGDSFRVRGPGVSGIFTIAVYYPTHDLDTRNTHCMSTAGRTSFYNAAQSTASSHFIIVVRPYCQTQPRSDLVRQSVSTMQSSFTEDLLQAVSTQVVRPESLMLALLLLCIGSVRVWRRNDITGSKGRIMKVLGIKDLRLKLLRRFMRNNISVNQTFTNASSAEISNQGRELAGDDPYLIRCGPYEELVISQPDQVHDFYQGDYKRKNL